MSSRHALSASRPRLQAVNERLRLRSRSSPPDEDRRRSPPRNRRRPAAQPQATPPRAQVTARPRRAPQALGPGLRPPLVKLEPLYPPCCPPFLRPPGADPGDRGPPPRPSVPAWADPHVASRDRPLTTDPSPFDRGRPASNPGAAAPAEAKPMERSAVSQLATATRGEKRPVVKLCPPYPRLFFLI